jgi:hypothetical protein
MTNVYIKQDSLGNKGDDDREKFKDSHFFAFLQTSVRETFKNLRDYLYIKS